ncbi:M16 family peptidase [Gottschalkia acidurici 9a]|uniref:M16 family peptidase n=1 Tax=Gottschalkia acidurici (strain ATCC 7906 / DSM 604 / BCRC 14475 / CIP 104303 / KCTC 5404 / NCIMB 10678 / 9a) TaxID=1128398 RepID=K0B0G3_GOTA9|nr:pitrilysin family protein [Gottschalkia acidurici]AFS78557.1 M16 family peptidase [Gottschalkia acidurici 9a]
MYNKKTLENGLRIVTEYIPYVKSVSIGIWVEAGSIRENVHNNGVTHFIEHMIFKGTEKRTAKEIAESIDNIGGQINAFTSKECTCYYVKVLDNHLSDAIEILADMLFNSKFDEEEMKKEKGVILEEIKMYEDSPEDLVTDLLAKSIFNNHQLGMPILGSSETLNNLTREDILDYYKTYYTPENTVISIAGNFKEEDIMDLIKEYFGNWEPNQKNLEVNNPPKIDRNIISKVKDIEQMHLCLGMEGINSGNMDLYPLLVLNNIFGGGMSSRLFQTVREDMGLAYSIYSYMYSYKDVGVFSIYAGMNKENILTVSEIIVKNINEIKKNLINEEEMNKSKEQLKGNYILGLESTFSRMSYIGRSELLLGRTDTPEELLEKIDKVKIEDIRKIVDKVFSKDSLNISIVGNIEDEEKLAKELNLIYDKII